MPNSISRRELIQKSFSQFWGIIYTSVVDCLWSDNNDSTSPTTKVEFLHGVASGDPLKDRVILWTRITPQDTSLRLEVVWEIATDDKFTQVINTGKVQTASAQDFTIKVDADKLKSGQTYYYRFKFGSVISPVGRTKTLPETTSSVQFAVCSCSNYPCWLFLCV